MTTRDRRKGELGHPCRAVNPWSVRWCRGQSVARPPVSGEGETAGATGQSRGEFKGIAPRCQAEHPARRPRRRKEVSAALPTAGKPGKMPGVRKRVHVRTWNTGTDATADG